MTTSKFDQQVFIEQLRYIEVHEVLAGDDDELAAELAATHDFSTRLWQRATRLIDRNEFRSTMNRAAKLTRIAKLIALLVAALLGALATSLALAGGSTINVYWLLLVLLGFNFLSMLLWLVGISLNLEGLISGVLTRFTSWLPRRLKHKSQTSAAADRAWITCHFSGRVGKWQLSAITHQLWLVYLLSGLAVLVLVLMARQYDIVWGTTLLADNTFVRLTELLGKPLQLLGLTTPTAEQVLQTRMGTDRTFSAAHSNIWAQFLLGALLVYGILPRLLLWVWSMLMRAAAKRSFKLDYYLPYYIDLRQGLFKQSGQAEIVDRDKFPPVIAGAINPKKQPDKVPVEAHWVAVELGENFDWPPLTVSSANNLGQISDRQSLARTVQRLENEAADVIAVAVTAARAPDRGVQRTITEILATSKQSWLVLLQPPDSAIADSRLGAWYRLAEACGVAADHVIIMSAV